MIKKQSCPFFIIIECDGTVGGVEDSCLRALLYKLKYEIETCTTYDVRVLLNKVPKRLLRKSYYASSFGVLQYNRDPSNPFYDMRPRPNSFEVSTVRGELIFSRLRDPNVLSGRLRPF